MSFCSASPASSRRGWRRRGRHRTRVSARRSRRAAERVAAAGAELERADCRAELVAEELRGALRALDFLVGRVDVEAVLDVIFQSFCLGK